MPNVSLCAQENEVHYNPIEPPLPNNVIKYEASAKLSETTNPESGGIHTNAFNTTMVSHTFENGVGTIEFEDDVTILGDWAFGFSNITKISIPNSVTSINFHAFVYCHDLTSVMIPNSVTSIGDGAFNTCGSLTSITIPNSVTSIGDGAFSNCGSLTSITIPNSVTSIGDGAFQSCSGLTSITIPDSVTIIGENAFTYCSGLTSVTIGSGVTSIGESAFKYCGNIQYCTINSITPPAIEQRYSQYPANETFSGNYPIYVPSESVNAYKTAQYWSHIASRIQATPTT